ncbi:hypothetical protein EDM80_03905 [bacterium]|nr:MAG: hypothetical protein EDM80_03905 [bacterium]RIK65679.1 MAG: hypothetical protein DCC64_00765 [Planctomycetota bacterium]
MDNPENHRGHVALLAARLAFSAAGVALVCIAALTQAAFPALGAALAFWAGEALGLVQLGRRFEDPVARTLQCACEAMCALGVSVILPQAMLVALIQVVHALVASGIGTVSGAQGKPLPQPRGEPVRRVLAAFANACLALTLFAASQGYDVQTMVGLSGTDLALLCAAVVALAGIRSITESGLAARWGK